MLTLYPYSDIRNCFRCSFCRFWWHDAHIQTSGIAPDVHSADFHDMIPIFWHRELLQMFIMQIFMTWCPYSDIRNCFRCSFCRFWWHDARILTSGLLQMFILQIFMTWCPYSDIGDCFRCSFCRFARHDARILTSGIASDVHSADFHDMMPIFPSLCKSSMSKTLVGSVDFRHCAHLACPRPCILVYSDVSWCNLVYVAYFGVM